MHCGPPTCSPANESSEVSAVAMTCAKLGDIRRVKDGMNRLHVSAMPQLAGRHARAWGPEAGPLACSWPLMEVG